MGLKELYDVVEVSKAQAKEMVVAYHYLGKKDFTFMKAYGLQSKEDGQLYGVAVFGMVGGASALKGWFGIGNQKEFSQGIYELNRLVMHPSMNKSNATSFLLGNALKRLRKEENARAVISLADTDIHVGYIYQACNFGYFGETDKKSDFFAQMNAETGEFKANGRMTTRDKQGVWLPRSVKHRYAIVWDKNLTVLYPSEVYPKKHREDVSNCCQSVEKVYDNRYGKWFTCPKCKGVLLEIEE